MTTPKRSVVSDHNAEVLLQFWHLDGDRFPPPPTTQLALRTPEARCTALRGRQRTLLLSARTTPQLLRLVGCPNVLRARLVVIPFDPGTPIEQLLSKL